MTKYSYTPKKWCISATKLIYKPNKINPHNPTNYIPIALMNGILQGALLSTFVNLTLTLALTLP